MDLDLSVEHTEQLCLLRVAGEIDLATMPGLRGRLYELIDAGERHIVVDLSRVTFLDLSGIGGLIAAVKAMGPSGRIVLAGPTDRVARVLALTGLTHLIQVHDTIELEDGSATPKRRRVSEPADQRPTGG